MAATEDLINFDIIEDQKENIQSLPSGRSAKALAQIFSPVAGVTSPAQTQDINDSARQEYENELANIDECDDPLDVYDRYVRWTLDAYPSASATRQSRLLPLLERATKALQGTEQYKNDPRYLKIWLHYIRLFSDAPRETFAFLARHGIGSGLALYYEEFAAWLEQAQRWNQAEEVYKTGIERQARPTERLMRKFGEFEKRAENRPQGIPEPSSPAIPTFRPALAAKVDPFSVTSPTAADPQAASRQAQPANSRKAKMQIFSDDGEPAHPTSEEAVNGWQSMGTLAERRKENIVVAKAWTGEKLQVEAKPNSGTPKMMVFKDQSKLKYSNQQPASNHSSLSQKVVNERTGKLERVFVNLAAVYPNPQDSSEEYCFEELRAAKRGWLQRDWGAERRRENQESLATARPANVSDTTTTIIPLAPSHENPYEGDGCDVLPSMVATQNDENRKLSVEVRSEVEAARRLRREERANRTRRIREETRTIQTNLDSPQGPKIKRKKSTEPTMTVHTKAATDEIYEIFNQPLQSTTTDADEGADSDYETDDDDYTSAGESTGTGRISSAASDYGEETQGELEQNRAAGDDNTTTTTGDQDNTEWSEFTTSKHMPKESNGDDDDTGTCESLGSSYEVVEHENKQTDHEQVMAQQDQDVEEVVTPTSPTPQTSRIEPKFIPIPPDDYVPSTRAYRDPAQIAANRLPFMTPIVEKTESSLGALTGKAEQDYFNSKTPCPKAEKRTPAIEEADDDLLSSPFQEIFDDPIKEKETAKKPLPRPMLVTSKSQTFPRQLEIRDVADKGPIIKDAQCNPMDDNIHRTILRHITPPLNTYEGFFEYENVEFNHLPEIRKFCKSLLPTKSSKAGSDKPQSSISVSPILRFDGVQREYAIKRELGAGAYAPVYLLEQVDDSEKSADENGDAAVVMGRGNFGIGRQRLEALKMEDPPSAWEFYMLRTAHRRLGVSRPAESIVQAFEMHLFKDEGYLIEEYRDQGTLLDLVNILSEQSRASGGHNGMEEMLAMFLTVEILRTVEALHSKAIIHGDLKADNILVRLSTGQDDEQLSADYRRNGASGWSSRGVTLIDFGRSIDMRAFQPTVQFIADWSTSATDCAEMRELRPWTYQADYHGIAAIAHTMLFGKYIETVVEKNGPSGIVAGAARNYKLKEGLKRYWQTEIWGDFFSLLLNPGRHLENEEGQRMPCTKGLKRVRELMEAYLEANAEKGVGLKGMVRKVETLAGIRKRA